MEFLTKDALSPDQFPADGRYFTLSGAFETYERGGYPHIRLIDAILSE